MAIFDTDQFYIQRPSSSGPDQKMKATGQEILNYVQTDQFEDLQKIRAAILLEARQRAEGDEALEDKIYALAQKISNIGTEIFPVTKTGSLFLRSDSVANNNYIVEHTACENGPDYPSCLEGVYDAFHTTVSGPSPSPTNAFYIASTNGTYGRVESIVVSSVIDPDTGESVNWIDELLPDGQTNPGFVGTDSYIEFTQIEQKPDGTERLSLDNYILFKVKNWDYAKKDDGYTTDEYTYRLDVETIISSGDPVISSPDNKYAFSVMRDLKDTLSDIYVEVEGDTMTGPLNISVPGSVDPVLHADGLLRAAVVDIDRYNNLSDTNTGQFVGVPDLLFNANNPLVKFSSEDTATVEIGSILDIRTSTDDVDRQFLTLTSGHYTLDGDGAPIVHPEGLPYINEVEIAGKLIIKERAYYDGENITLETNQNVLTPKAYVDLRDTQLQVNIDDVEQKVNALANSVLMFGYQLDGDAAVLACNDTFDTEYQAAGADEAARATALQNWETCVLPSLNTQRLDYITYETTWDNNGVQDVKQEHRWILHNQAFDISTGGGGTIELDFAWNIDDELNAGVVRPGDYMEVSSIDLRSPAFILYRVTDVRTDTNANPYGIITADPVYMSGTLILTANINVKFYDKTTGLSIDDTDLRYVKLAGDTMTGPLEFDTDSSLVETVVLSHHNAAYPLDPDKINFKVTNTGIASFSEIYIADEDGTNELHIQGSEINFLDFTKQSTFTTDNEFFFKISGNKQFGVKGNNTVKFYGNTLDKIGDPVDNESGINKGWFEDHVFGKTNKFITVSKKSGDGGVEIAWDGCDVEELNDVVEDANKVTNAVLQWNGSKWKASSKAITPFKPGQQVAAFKPEDAEVGGLYISETGQLFVRLES